MIRSDSDPVRRGRDGRTAGRVQDDGPRVDVVRHVAGVELQQSENQEARTLLTSFAGSIGIIGIALILSVSTGVNTYISDIQRDTMTAYPITVDSQTFDLSSMMGGQMGGDDGYGGKTHKTDGIYPDDRSVKQASSLTSRLPKTT